MKLQFITHPRPSNLTDQEWNSWTWQLQNSLKSQADFEKNFELTEEEKKAFRDSQGVFNIRTTPYYANLCRPDPKDPLRRIMMPTVMELEDGQQALLDPLGEKKNNPVSRIIHRYSDRVLFLVTDICSVYCRYCTRKHFTGQDQAFIKESEFHQALDYVRSHPEIREVILSGGDPLTLSDSHLEKVLSSIREIDHVEIIRVGTRMPVVCPMRVTPELSQILRKYAPVFVMTHFNHPREVTLEAKQALEMMVDHGVPVLNQMVLLNGVNNHPAIVQALSRRLLACRVKPYYMFQCDPSEGSDHFRTSIEDSEAIQRELWGHLSGLAMPTLSLDIPNGGGKVTLAPNFEIFRDSESRTYKGWDGVVEKYVNPSENLRQTPADVSEYQTEWNLIRGKN
ncbi:MAG: L-lysine 2,3-aminomutase [Oligoflexia bacterium]|nr:MAG: L-lysine 2,3-aminomutase [Oligoflexia bacterium]